MYMGILRLYLSLCVVADHSGSIFPWSIHDGSEAVQIFFIISGFYMAMVYRKYASVYEFYISRFLRIFIPYWFVLAMIIVVRLISGFGYGAWAELSPYVHDALQHNGLFGV